MKLESRRSEAESLFPSVLRGVRGQSARPQGGWLVRVLPFLTTLRDYRAADLRPDFVAGLTVALFTIPQAMAYSLIAGFPPSVGIYTAVMASILGAAMGSSEFLINGPTNAIVVMLAANAALFAAQGDPLAIMVMLTFVIGAVQVAAGIARVGALTRFVSEPVLTGFTAGAGMYIVINQLPAFLGIAKASISRDLWGWQAPKSAFFDLLCLLKSLTGIQWTTAGLALLTLVVVRLLQRLEKRIGRRLPAPFAAVMLATGLVWLFALDQPGPQHISVVRDIEALGRTLPAVRLPAFDLDVLRAVAGPAFAIGLMGSVEAIAIGKMLAQRAGHPFDASRQLIGEGFCNLGAAAVGGFASSGSFSRTAVNYDAGAVTRVSCILSGVLVFLIVFAFAPVANLIPIAALAGTLVHIGLKLIDVARIQALLGTTTADRAVLLTTFAGVLFVEHLERALYLGIAVSIYFALRRAEGFKLRELTQTDDGGLGEGPSEDAPAQPSPITVLNLQGELFFAAAEVLQAELVKRLDTSARFIVLRVQEAYNLDATTAGAIAHVAEEARRRGGRLLLCGVRPGMHGTFERAGLIPRIGADAIFVAENELLASTRRAIRHAQELARQAEA